MRSSKAVLPLVHTSGMEVDLVVAGSGLEALALGRADRIAVDGVEVPVAHTTDLVVMKDELEERVLAWLHERPGAEHGGAEGTPVVSRHREPT